MSRLSEESYKGIPLTNLAELSVQFSSHTHFNRRYSNPDEIQTFTTTIELVGNLNVIGFCLFSSSCFSHVPSPRTWEGDSRERESLP